MQARQPNDADFRRDRLLPCPNSTCQVRAGWAQANVERVFKSDESGGVPRKFREARLEDFATLPRLLADVRAAETERRGLFIFGPKGVGKSHLAAAVLRRRLEVGRTGLFIIAPDLLDELKATWNRMATQTESDLHRTLRELDTLVLDDLGTETDSDWARTKLFQLVDGRYRQERELVCTSNLPPEVLELPGRLGERTVSRLLGACRLIEMSGQDRRLIEAARR